MERVFTDGCDDDGDDDGDGNNVNPSSRVAETGELAHARGCPGTAAFFELQSASAFGYGPAAVSRPYLYSQGQRGGDCVFGIVIHLALKTFCVARAIAGIFVGHQEPLMY